MHVSENDKSQGQDRNNVEKGQGGLGMVGSVIWDDYRKSLIRQHLVRDLEEVRH